MKKLLLGLLFTISLFSLIKCAKTCKSVYESDLPKGYKECNVYEFSFKSGEWDEKSKLKVGYIKYDNKNNIIEEVHSDTNGVRSKEICKYDKYGNQIFWVMYKKNGTVNRISRTYKYDKNGKILELIINRYDGSPVEIETYIYNDKGKILEFKKKRYDGSSIQRETYKYDDKGNILEFIKNCYNGSPVEIETYKYDSKGNEIENIVYKGFNIVSFIFRSKYDDKGNKIETIGFDSVGSQFIKFNYKYTDKGIKIQDIEFDQNDLITSITRYNDEGLFIEDVNYYDGSIDSRLIYKYDNKGFLIEEISYYQDGEVDTRTTYIYDRTGYKKIYEFFSQSDASTIITTYDNYDKVIEYICYDSNSIITHHHKNRYDSNENMIEQIIYNLSNQPEKKYEFVFSK